MATSCYNGKVCFSCFPGGSNGKESACYAGDLDSIPGLGGSPGEGNGNPLQYSCLENSMDRGAWRATANRVTKSQTGLSDFTFTFLYHQRHLGSSILNIGIWIIKVQLPFLDHRSISHNILKRITQYEFRYVQSMKHIHLFDRVDYEN